MNEDLRSLCQALLKDSTADAAAAALRRRPGWGVGTPPSEFVSALLAMDFNQPDRQLALARPWDRVALGEALWQGFGRITRPVEREHAAWLLSHLASPNSWRSIARRVIEPQETREIRVFLIQALDRLCLERHIGWAEIGTLIATLARDPDPAVRQAAIDLLISLPSCAEMRAILIERLDDTHESVLRATLHAFIMKGINLDHPRLRELAADPRSAVRLEAQGIIGRQTRQPRV
ncbi:MAG TPA: HEAT repeat domain-containing protein [Polyangia bacterium]|jgi:hypothetical protein|nr:HEAT repeat domain-containing protein [Polyangia bacterium]